MTPPELKAALREAGLRQRAFAELTGVIPLTVNRWCNGKQPIPKWVGELLRARREAAILEQRATFDRELAALHGSRSQTGDIPPS